MRWYGDRNSFGKDINDSGIRVKAVLQITQKSMSTNNNKECERQEPTTEETKNNKL